MHACMVRLGTNESFGQATGEMAFHHQVRVSKESVRLYTREAGEVYERLQADAEARTILTVEAPSARHMLSVDAAKVHTTTGEWRDMKTLTLAEVKPTGKTHRNTYFSRMSDYTAFARDCQIEVHRRGLKSSPQACAVNDGADWIPEVVTACRPDAVRILDFYHAAQHLAEAARAVFGDGTPAFHAWFETHRRELRDGDPDRVLAALGQLALEHPQHVEIINATQGYLLKRRDLICYVDFKAAHWPIGSGPGEAAHKVVIQARMKRAGMRWHTDNINPMAAMRNLVCNQRWDTDWPLILKARRGSPTNKTPATPSLLPSGFKLRPRTPWRNQPVGSARARPTS